MTPTRTVRVMEAEAVTPSVKRFTLEAADGRRLPAWSGGSHVTVTLTDGARAWRNAYSLTGEPGEVAFYQIAVRRADPARGQGGSAFLHDRVGVGDTLEIDTPVNHFPLARRARRHLLIAGGIGVTPFLAQMAALKKTGQPYALHYAVRTRQEGAFRDTLRAAHGPQTTFYVSEEGRRLDPHVLMDGQPLGTHAYVCGPPALIRAVRDAAAALGWPDAHVHAEEFTPAPVRDAAPFTARLPALGLDVPVGARETLLEALEAAGVPVASSCRVGRCGTCALRVLGGDPDHHDHCLSDAERAAGRLLACVSRGRMGRLTLGLL